MSIPWKQNPTDQNSSLGGNWGFGSLVYVNVMLERPQCCLNALHCKLKNNFTFTFLVLRWFCFKTTWAPAFKLKCVQPFFQLCLPVYVGPSPKHIWFNLELERSIQSDPNHDLQKDQKASALSLLNLIFFMEQANRWHSTDLQCVLSYKQLRQRF